MTSPVIYLVVGEPSGDALGADLMQAIRQQRPDVMFAGVGGEAMAAQGLQSLFPYNDLSIMGFWEIIPHIPALLKRLRQTADDIIHKHPSVLVTIDSPGFNFRLARMLSNNARAKEIRRIHYVAPSVWAYKPQRARKTAQLFDALLVLLPFEPPYFEKEGLPTVFVGHPVLWQKTQGDSAAFRSRHGIAVDAPILLLLPGSRTGEIKHHLTLFLEAARALPSFTPVILAGSQVKERIAKQCPQGTIIADIAQKQDAFAAASLALTKSGTISLELAAAGVAMVVAHRGSPLSAWLIRRMIRISYASLVNIALNRLVIPELLQERCNIADITRALIWLSDPQAGQEQRRLCAQALDILRGGSREAPGVIAARTVLANLG